jgi:hypothetical protein
VKDLIGDPAIFRRTSEGEKVVRILDAWKSRLSRDQLRFLRLLGIHPRAVSEDSFKVLVWHYGRRGRDRGWAARTIVDPLVDAGLIERLEAADGRVSYSAHPLMKFGFSAWLGARRSRNAHREWATAAIGRPDHSIVFAILHIDTLEEIQPYLDAVEHYIAAADFATAWEIYDGAGLHRRLHEIGHESTLRDVMTKFEEAAAGGQWTPQAITLEAIYRCLATSSSALDDRVGLRLYEPRRYDASLRTGDLFLIAASGASLVETSLDEGWMEKAAEQLESLRKRLAGGSPAADLSPVHAAEVKAALLAGEYARTIGFADRVLTRKLVSHDEFVVRVRAYKARALIGVGEVADGLALFQETKSAHINRRDQQSILSWMVDAELRQGNVEAAERYDEEQRAVARSLGFAPRPAFGILLARGDFDAARADIDRWRAGVHEGEGPGSGIRIDIAAAQLLAARDHVDEARRLAADVRGRMDACGYRLGWELLQPMLETERP